MSRQRRDAFSSTRPASRRTRSGLPSIRLAVLIFVIGAIAIARIGPWTGMSGGGDDGYDGYDGGVPPAPGVIDEAAGGSTIGSNRGVPHGLPMDPAETEGTRLDRMPWTVDFIPDADTIHVERDGQVEKVRLLGLNAPETGDGRRAVQCFGEESQAFAQTFFGGREVYLGTDPAIPDRDQYGRLLAYVWLDDGTFANLELLAQGYATEYTFDRPYRHRALFRDAMREARAGQRGLWSQATCGGDYDP